MIDTGRMRSLAEARGIDLDDKQLAQLDLYAELLVEWNAKINLTAITEPGEIEVKHFLDSLIFADLEQVRGALADVGTGAGFPGVVAKILKPELDLTLIEPTGKRVTFLTELTGQLGIEAEILKERAEEAARKGWRGRYDVVCARAVAALPMLCEYCLPLAKTGGWFIAMKGAEDETAQAQNATALLGGEMRPALTYTLPGEMRRTLVLVFKVKDTPEKYPRAGGVIKKRPL